MLYYYEMKIDGVEYVALFLSHLEASEFMDAREKEDGSTVVVTSFKEVSVQQALKLHLEWGYIIEVVGKYLMPNFTAEFWIDVEYKLRDRFPFLFD